MLSRIGGLTTGQPIVAVDPSNGRPLPSHALPHALPKKPTFMELSEMDVPHVIFSGGLWIQIGGSPVGGIGTGAAPGLCG